jgi:NTP pyrophosphatase (non-canonical NTP hydrolase)
VNNLSEYQKEAARTAIYPGSGQEWAINQQRVDDGLTYVALGLAGEAGEVGNTLKKALRDDRGKVTPERRAKVIGEMGDVLWYLARLATHLNVELSEVARQNVVKLRDRQERDVLGGDGGER